MKKKVAQQIEELSVQERKTIFRAGMLSEKIGAVLIVVVLLSLALSFWNWMQANKEWNAFLTDHSVGDLLAVGTRLVEAFWIFRLSWIASCVVLLFYGISSNIYLRKNVPYYTGRRFSYLFWSKKRRKRLLEE